MRSAFALRIFSGKNIFNRAMPERLRTLRHCIFTRRGRKGKRQLPRLLPAEAAARRESFLFAELPQSKPDGFASFLGEGASGAPGAHSTASEMSLPSSSTSTTSIMGRMKRAPFFRAKWDPSRLPRMLLTAQGMPMWNTTRPFIR